jgi:hypothetical protein
MDRRVMDFLSRRMRDRADNRDRRDSRDYRDYRDYEDERDYEDMEDSRRGVRGSGRGGNRGGRGRSRDSRDYEDERDYRDERDYNDYGGNSLYLSKSDMHRWKKNMENVDGTHGEHYDTEEIMHVAEKLGIKFKQFDEKEFCLAVNMMYSDYCKVVKKHVPPEKELMFYAELAKAFLEDPDGPEPSEKLALYFHCIAEA